MQKNLFITNPRTPPADSRNNAGGAAYTLPPKEALVQYVITGFLGSTCYVDAVTQVDEIIRLCELVDYDFIAKLALYARQKGYMKDTAALLVAILAAKRHSSLEKIFPVVINNGKMLRNFMKIIRSGKLGIKSFGTRTKRIIKKWLNDASDERLIKAYIGNDPSLADIIKMVHPKAITEAKNQLFKWVMGKPFTLDSLPEEIIKFEIFKRSEDNSSMCFPDVPFQMLTSLPLSLEQWKAIALNGGWHMVRMNLNTFLRHGALGDKGVVMHVVKTLTDKETIKNSMVYPYQLLTTFLNIEGEMPTPIKFALQDAMEIATENVPAIGGNVVIGVDVSGSMSSLVTGYRERATTKARFIDVAALFAACILRKNQYGVILPFENGIVSINLNPRDTVMTNATNLASIGGGGTNMSSVLMNIIANDRPVDTLIIISDSESWVDSISPGYIRYCISDPWGRAIPPEVIGPTSLMDKWNRIKHKNPNAKLICINIEPTDKLQSVQVNDVYNICGFSDTVFDLVANIANDESQKMVDIIEKTII